MDEPDTTDGKQSHESSLHVSRSEGTVGSPVFSMSIHFIFLNFMSGS